MKLFSALLGLSLLVGSVTLQAQSAKLQTVNKNKEKMKVEIWSDIVCPFCYIGKRHYEKAIQELGFNEEIEVVWRSYQLDPTTKVDKSKKVNSYESFAEKKGISVAQAKQMFDNVKQMAAKAGLNYNFDISVPANTKRAHLVLQKAKEKGLGDALKEQLLKAYFMEGKDVDDENTLIALGKTVGLTEAEVKTALTDATYNLKLQADLKQASEYGITGVPFFVVDGKYGISGAQPVDVFKQTLKGAYEEWEKANAGKPKLKVIDGQTCKPTGECD